MTSTVAIWHDFCMTFGLDSKGGEEASDPRPLGRDFSFSSILNSMESGWYLAFFLVEI
jgi:hypothetical protein